jgi:hypothetical protein
VLYRSSLKYLTYTDNSKCASQYKLDISAKIDMTHNNLHQHLISNNGGITPGNLTIVLYEMLRAKTDVGRENNITGISNILEHFKYLSILTLTRFIRLCKQHTTIMDSYDAPTQQVHSLKMV